MKKTILFPSDFPTVPPEVGNQTTVVVILDQEDQFWKYYNSLVT